MTTSTTAVKRYLWWSMLCYSYSRGRRRRQRRVVGAAAAFQDGVLVGIPHGYCWTPGALIASGPLTDGALHRPYSEG